MNDENELETTETPVQAEITSVQEDESLAQDAPEQTQIQDDNTQIQSTEAPVQAEETQIQDAAEQNYHTLKVNSLYKMFGRKKVVQGVDFKMHTGEVLGLLGPNGAGKTTTFYMIVGFYKPTAGEIFLDDQRITGLPMFKRARLGISYLPQEPSVFRKLTVEENIWSILETRVDLTHEQKKQRLEELIEEFSIGRIRKQQAFTLSGGERRRTEIARSLAIEPKFLLLDEPFAGIDPIAVADIKAMIKLLAKRGIGILITDHNVRDTLEITDRAIIISTGQILVQGGKEDIIASPEAREIYLGENFHM
jgi:lipopolysaccharide export system ATP-binding protein